MKAPSFKGRAECCSCEEVESLRALLRFIRVRCCLGTYEETGRLEMEDLALINNLIDHALPNNRRRSVSENPTIADFTDSTALEIYEQWFNNNEKIMGQIESKGPAKEEE